MRLTRGRRAQRAAHEAAVLAHLRRRLATNPTGAIAGFYPGDPLPGLDSRADQDGAVRRLLAAGTVVPLRTIVGAGRLALHPDLARSQMLAQDLALTWPELDFWAVPLGRSLLAGDGLAAALGADEAAAVRAVIALAVRDAEWGRTDGLAPGWQDRVRALQVRVTGAGAGRSAARLVAALERHQGALKDLETLLPGVLAR